MSSLKPIQLEGSEGIFSGDPSDPYFANLQAFANEARCLGAFVRENVQTGMIIDVGANIGVTSMIMATAAPTVRVTAYEPSPLNAVHFARNLARYQNVDLVPMGLADRPGDLEFVISPCGANCHVAGRDYEFHGHPLFKPSRVKVTTLDREMPVERVALIKIDVEGFEPNVLAGARKLLHRDAPWIWMEFNAVALNVAHGYSPMAFAVALFQAHEVYFWTSGSLVPVENAATLVHHVMVRSEGICDIIMRPRPGQALPSLREMTAPRRPGLVDRFHHSWRNAVGHRHSLAGA